MPNLEPTPEQFRDFRERVPETGPIAMLNLLRFRSEASYGEPEESCSGREAYARYMGPAAELVASVGGRVLWAARGLATLIGREDESWDDVLIVEYPNRAAFEEMLAQPEYQAIVHHRQAALADSRLIATAAVTG